MMDYLKALLYWKQKAITARPDSSRWTFYRARANRYLRMIQGGDEYRSVYLHDLRPVSRAKSLTTPLEEGSMSLYQMADELMNAPLAALNTAYQEAQRRIDNGINPQRYEKVKTLLETVAKKRGYTLVGSDEEGRYE